MATLDESNGSYDRKKGHAPRAPKLLGDGEGAQLDRVEVEVRARVTALLSSAGVGQDGVAKEVLYWLPEEFVEAYRRLMDKALVIKGVGVPGGDADRGFSGVDQGRILEKGRTPSKLRGGPRGLGMGGGGGKKWVNSGWVVKDEGAFRFKEKIDRILKEMAYGTIPRAMGRLDTQFGATGRLVERRVGRGARDGRGEEGEGGRIQKVCEDCGRIASSDWARCPFHE